MRTNPWPIALVALLVCVVFGVGFVAVGWVMLRAGGSAYEYATTGEGALRPDDPDIGAPDVLADRDRALQDVTGDADEVAALLRPDVVPESDPVGVASRDACRRGDNRLGYPDGYNMWCVVSEIRVYAVDPPAVDPGSGVDKSLLITARGVHDRLTGPGYLASDDAWRQTHLPDSLEGLLRSSGSTTPEWTGLRGYTTSAEQGQGTTIRIGWATPEALPAELTGTFFEVADQRDEGTTVDWDAVRAQLGDRRALVLVVDRTYLFDGRT